MFWVVFCVCVWGGGLHVFSSFCNLALGAVLLLERYKRALKMLLCRRGMLPTGNEHTAG